jgi:CheY-like chemotaxis protein
LAKEGNKCDELREIIKATLHSADITRQLLAFARKQTISPKLLDLNRCVENTLKMLRRLIGENIELEWLPQNNLGSVKMDMVQVDRILANLCINAKDAMDDNGKITIETRMVIVDEAYCQSHPEFHPGEYACLAVSDTGTGMDKKTQEKIFDPFFTSKGMGEGTGLGLSTVYGIVKQNKGLINVSSELGKGTTFNIYLARYESPVEQGYPIVRSRVETGTGEAILLVEDDEDILGISRQMLTSLGYQVIDTRSPAQALILARENKDILKLLITDVILPDMNGRELSGRVQEECPNLKILFMSGYTANVIAPQGVLDDGVHFVQKPFSKQELATKVRSVLDM